MHGMFALPTDTQRLESHGIRVRMRKRTEGLYHGRYRCSPSCCSMQGASLAGSRDHLHQRRIQQTFRIGKRATLVGEIKPKAAIPGHLRYVRGQQCRSQTISISHDAESSRCSLSGTSPRRAFPVFRPIYRIRRENSRNAETIRSDRDRVFFAIALATAVSFYAQKPGAPGTPMPQVVSFRILLGIGDNDPTEWDGKVSFPKER